MIKISVIMPAYNVETLIEKSVESVMKQTLQDIELIVVNDASTDGTWDKICALTEIYKPKMKAINLTKNVRQGGARNIGIKESQGEYIAFVDSDDWIKPDMLEKFYSAIVENDADLAGTGKYYKYYSDKKIEEISNIYSYEVSGKIADKEIREKYCLYLGGIWRNLYKREIIINNNIWFPEKVSYEDSYFFVLYLAYVNKYICVDEPFYYYRYNTNSTVHRKDYTQLDRIKVEKQLLAEYKKRGLYDDVKDGYDAMCIQRWYVNTIGLWFSRFGRESVKLTTDMGREFRAIFPNYRKNKYFKLLINKKDRMKLVLFEAVPWLLYITYAIKKIIKKG